MEELNFLEEQKVSPELISQVEKFRRQYEVPAEAAGRVVKPAIPFFGKDILEMAIAGILEGKISFLQTEGHGKKRAGGKILPIFSTGRLIMFLFM